jgi:hypothetical protein
MTSLTDSLIGLMEMAAPTRLKAPILDPLATNR